jgi:lipid A 3-O-deacylase
MKTGKFMTVVFLVFILLAGCTGKKPSRPEIPHDEIVHGIAPEDNIISNRFQEITDPGSVTVPDSASEDYLYYLPEAVTSIHPVYPAEAKPSPEEKQEEYRIMTRPAYSDYEQLLLKTGRTSPEVFFIAVFDNDIFDYTDYYYTNGIILQLFHPAIGSSPIARALPGLNNSINYYGISLVQNMYTPLKLEDLQPRIGDRPFAAYLTIGHQRVSLSPLHHQRLQTELVLGVIGPASGGNLAQDLIHTNTPVGWVNQVENDFIVNYSLRFDQGIYHSRNIDLAVSGGGQAGTLYDNLTAGFLVRVGRTNDLYNSLFQTTKPEKPFRKRVRYYIGADIRQKLILYDATMQGGMFNHESPYTLDAGQVKRFVFTGTVLLGLGLGKYSLEAEQVYLGPEFDGGRHHYWFRIKNIIRLN